MMHTETEVNEIRFGEHVIEKHETAGTAYYLPLPDIEEHKRYFCWSIEAAILTRFYYLENGRVHDMLLVNIMHELGGVDHQPGTTKPVPSTRLAVLMEIDGRAVELGRTLYT
jgi:hypothetical protein